MKKRLLDLLRAPRRGEQKRLAADPGISYTPAPINEIYKQLFFLVCAPLHRINGFLYRRWRAPRSGEVKVQLGPGKRGYLEGWLNLDANIVSGKCDIWVNLNNPLPFRDNTVDVIFSHQVIEHLKDQFFHFQEIQRVLKPGGVFRIGGPNGDAAMRKYVEGDLAWFWDFPDNRKSIGGRLENLLFCRGEHVTILTPSFLQEMAEYAGLIDFHTCLPVTETRYPKWINADVLKLEWETTPECPHNLIVEGRKPN